MTQLLSILIFASFLCNTVGCASKVGVIEVQNSLDKVVTAEVTPGCELNAFGASAADCSYRVTLQPGEIWSTAKATQGQIRSFVLRQPNGPTIIALIIQEEPKKHVFAVDSRAKLRLVIASSSANGIPLQVIYRESDEKSHTSRNAREIDNALFYNDP